MCHRSSQPPREYFDSGPKTISMPCCIAFPTDWVPGNRLFDIELLTVSVIGNRLFWKGI